ncbi:MAG: PIN domain-containing protein [Desulfococcaceae bacterium]
MIAIDTNVLVRILVEDTGQIKQTHAARELARAAIQVYVPQIVQVETVWVLETAYKFSKSDIIVALEHLQNNSSFILQNTDNFGDAVKTFRNSNADFSDCLILAESCQQNMELYTFDKRLSKQKGAILVTPKDFIGTD